jgi:molybdopterin-biosynthesis enzyme MoeA-like protein
MAGVPKIMRAMLEGVIPTLKTGKVVISKTINVDIGESKIALIMTEAQKKHPEVAIGSYPYMQGDEFKSGGVNVVLRGTDEAQIDVVVAELMSAFASNNFKAVLC